MRHLLSHSLLTLGLSAWFVLPVQAVTYSPIANMTALGGQYFTNSTHSSGANVDASFVPVLGLSPKLYLIPILVVNYKETQNVYNFLGENTLVNKQLDTLSVLRLSWETSDTWRLKPRAGYKYEWAQQSTDGSLTGGLFNNQRLFGGLSAEHVLSVGTIELGYEYSDTTYPNYQSLSADPRLTATGITSNAGTNVLNFRGHETTLNYTVSADDKRWRSQNIFTWLREDFADQKVITQTDGGFEDFVDKKRTDDIFNLALTQSFRPHTRYALSLGEILQYYLSNQNAFDSSQLFVNPFTYRYYNFIDLQLNPTLTGYWFDGIFETSLAGVYGYRQYSHRKSQDGLGNYENKRIYSMNRGATLTLRYRLPPLGSVKGLSVMMTSSVLTYWSNTRYEANYPYNYTVYNYQGGLSWEY